MKKQTLEININELKQNILAIDIMEKILYAEELNKRIDKKIKEYKKIMKVKSKGKESHG